MHETEHNIEPPIIDLLRREQKAYVVTFVPSDEVSQAEKEVVAVPRSDVEGRQITPCLQKIGELLTGSRSGIDRIVHGGGGDFTFHFENHKPISLTDPGLDSAKVMRVYDLLRRISASVEVAFCVARTREMAKLRDAGPGARSALLPL